jgi:hypothetical protein
MINLETNWEHTVVLKNNIILEKYLLIGLKVEDIICQLCKDYIKDEVHFLLQCLTLQKERWEIINTYF